MLTDYARQFIRPAAIPEGTSGGFSIRRLTFSETHASLYNTHDYLNGDGNRRITPGSYTQLLEGETVWMSDTPAEQTDHLGFIAAAAGDILITGLGLGLVVAACLRKKEVKSVTVIELQADVILLVAPTLQKLAKELGKTFRVVPADAYAWDPDQLFDFAWHDIWPTISAENATPMREIMRHYTPWIRNGQECWVEARVFEKEAEDELTSGRHFLGGSVNEPLNRGDHVSEFEL
jgi:hypothetical protein